MGCPSSVPKTKESEASGHRLVTPPESEAKERECSISNEEFLKLILAGRYDALIPQTSLAIFISQATTTSRTRGARSGDPRQGRNALPNRRFETIEEDKVFDESERVLDAPAS